MSDEEVMDLLDRAVATVPPAVLQAPYAAIRRRARRRQVAEWGAAVTAGVLVIVGAVAIAQPDPTAAPILPAAPQATAGAAGVPWLGARINRAGTGVTVYAAPLQGKCVVLYPSDEDLVSAEDKVTMSLGGVYSDCADDTKVTQRTFELSQPVGSRFLVDGRSPYGQPFVFSDKDLPDLAAGGWSELSPQWLGSGDATLAYRFTRDGGPDLRVLAVRWQPEPDGTVEKPDHSLEIKGRRIDVYNHGGSMSASWWSSNTEAVHFTMKAGTAIGASEFDALLKGMAWT